MICDRLENSILYAGISPRLALAFEGLRSGGLLTAGEGRHEIDGDRVFALVQRYTTRPPEQCNLESHRRYIDVQVVAAGEEAIGHALRGTLEVSVPYDESRDVALYHHRDELSWLRLRAGDFAVFFPDDAHLPCAQAGPPAAVHKIVIKVLV